MDFRGFSQIFLAMEIDSSEKVAIKRIDCHSSREVERTRLEISCHRRFADEEHASHVMPLHGYSEEMVGTSRRFSLVFPLCEVGTIHAITSIHPLQTSARYSTR